MKRLLSLFLCVFLSFSFTVSAQEPNLELSAKSALLMEASTGTILYEKASHEPLPPASVTKIMTMLLVMEALDNGQYTLDDLVPVSELAASMGGSQVFLEPNEQMSVHDMLKAVAVASGNDAAVALAEYTAGSHEGFVAKMNERAKQLGMNDTHFVNCNGLDTDGHLTSAHDIALMSREIMKHPKIFEYTTIWMDSIRDGKFGLANTNKLIRFYEGANGLKTGSTSKARYCLTASAERDGMMLCAVVLGAPTSAKRFSAARSLLDYGFANFSVYRPKLEKVNEVKVVGGKAKSVKCHTSDSSVLLPKSEKNKVEEVVELPKQLKAPVKKGDVIGKVKYVSGDKTLLEKDIVASADVKKAGFFDIFKDIWSHVLYGK